MSGTRRRRHARRVHSSTPPPGSPGAPARRRRRRARRQRSARVRPGPTRSTVFLRPAQWSKLMPFNATVTRVAALTGFPRAARSPAARRTRPTSAHLVRGASWTRGRRLRPVRAWSCAGTQWEMDVHGDATPLDAGAYTRKDFSGRWTYFPPRPEPRDDRRTAHHPDPEPGIPPRSAERWVSTWRMPRPSSPGGDAGWSCTPPDQGYNDPDARFLRRGRTDGVEIVRLRFCSFGKRSIAVCGCLGGFSFVLQAIVRSVLLRHVDVVLVSTSPRGVARHARYSRAAFGRDQVLGDRSDPRPGLWRAGLVGSTRDSGSHAGMAQPPPILRAATDVVVLDRFMAERVNQKVHVNWKLANHTPPSPHDDDLGEGTSKADPFRRLHGLDDKFVLMYSRKSRLSRSNWRRCSRHCACSNRTELVGLFVGGIGKRKSKQSDPPDSLAAVSAAH